MIGDKAVKKGYIEPAPIGLDRLPFVPYMFQISRYGGLIRSDARRWYTNQAARTLDILINRYVQPDKQQYMGNVKAYALYNDWVIVGFKQNKAQAPFDFSPNFRRELHFTLRYDTLKNRRMFLAIMSIAREYQKFFDDNSGGLYDLWFSVFWVKPEMKGNKVVVERRRVKGLNSLHSILTTGLRTKAGNTDKLQSANPQISTVSAVEDSNVGVGVSPSFNITKSDEKDTDNYIKLNKLESSDDVEDFDEILEDFDEVEDFDIDDEDSSDLDSRESKADLRNGVGNIYNINSTVATYLDLHLQHEPNTIWAISNNKKIGKVCVYSKCIKDLWVEPEYRNMKIASCLMNEAIKTYNPVLIRPSSFTKSPITGIEASLSPVNLENFYNKFGFTMTNNGVMIRK